MDKARPRFDQNEVNVAQQNELRETHTHRRCRVCPAPAAEQDDLCHWHASVRDTARSLAAEVRSYHPAERTRERRARSPQEPRTSSRAQSRERHNQTAADERTARESGITAPVVAQNRNNR